jgi:hypothetical protein
VACACHPSYTRNLNRRIAIKLAQAKPQDYPKKKITELKMGWG